MRRYPAALLLVLAACGAPRYAGVRPERIPELEAAGDQRLLGQAYYSAGRFIEARDVLRTISLNDPADIESAAYLAFALDTLGETAAARAVYQRLAASGEPGAAQVARERLLLLDRSEAIRAARAALAREGALGGTPPQPNTVAVLPFRWTGADDDLAPLGRGFAELLTTDLALLPGVTVVERLNITALLDEMALGAAGLVDPATAARSGRLLQASDVVQGTLGGDRAALRVDAAVVGAGGAVRGAAAASDELERLFDLEAQVVFDLAERLGVTVDPATRARIAERPTQNVLAFMAYARGLAARDAGDFGGARAAFDQAVRIDPGFAAARAGAQQARGLSGAVGASPAALGGRVAGLQGAGRQRLRNTLARIAPSRADLLRDLRGRGGTLNRKAIQESTRTEGPGDAALSTKIIITISRPGSR